MVIPRSDADVYLPNVVVIESGSPYNLLFGRLHHTWLDIANLDWRKYKGSVACASA